MESDARARVLTPEERNRTMKAATLFQEALSAGISAQEVAESPEARERLLEPTRWDGASVACWEMVGLMLLAVDGDLPKS